MKIITSQNLDKNIQSSIQQSSITIGNFDGFHLGHQELFRDMVEHKRVKDSKHTLALTFDPNPKVFFKRASTSDHLFTNEQKARAFQEMGLDWLYFQKFDQEFAEIDYLDYYTNFIKGIFSPNTITIGDNFRFGFNRLGSLPFLKEKAAKDNFTLSIVSPKTWKDGTISSSRIRESLKEFGDVEGTKHMLGRPYCIEGQIVQGNQIGRKLETPTINLASVNQLIPKNGVYAGYVWLGAKEQSTNAPIMSLSKTAIPAVFNIGVRPSIKRSSEKAIEAHLLTGKYGKDSLYEYKAAFYLCYRLREERKFKSLEELKSQIKKDVELSVSKLEI